MSYNSLRKVAGFKWPIQPYGQLNHTLRYIYIIPYWRSPTSQITLDHLYLSSLCHFYNFFFLLFFFFYFYFNVIYFFLKKNKDLLSLSLCRFDGPFRGLDQVTSGNR